jgi:hypothetical protein
MSYHGPMIRKEDLTPLQRELHEAANEALHDLGFARDRDLEDAIENYRKARDAFRAAMRVAK